MKKKITVRACFLLLLMLMAGSATSQPTHGTLSIKKFSETSPYAAINELRNARSDSARIELLLKISCIYFRTRLVNSGYIDSALYYSRQAMAVSHTAHNADGYDEARFYTCKILTEIPRLDEAKQLLAVVTGKQRVRLLLVIAEHFMYQPNVKTTSLDEALPFANEALTISESVHSDNWRNQTLVLLGKIHFLRGSIAEGKKTFHQIITYCRAEHDTSAEAHYWAELARYMPDADETYADDISYFKESIRLYKLIRDSDNEADVYGDMGDASILHQEWDSAGKAFHQKLAILNATGKKKLYTTYLRLAEINGQIGNLNQSLHYALLSIENMKLNQNETEISWAYKILGDAYRLMGESDKSIIYYEKSFSTPYSRVSANLFSYITLKNYIDVLLTQGKANEAYTFARNFISRHPPDDLRNKQIAADIFGDYFDKTGRFKEAESSYLDMIRMDKEVRAAQIKTIFYSTNISGPACNYLISRFYIDHNMFGKAVPYLRTALSFKNTSPYLEKNIHYLQFRADSAAGNYYQGLKHYAKYVSISDSLAKVQQIRELSEMRIQFETAQKEDNIRLLEKEDLIQKTVIKDLSRVRLLTIAVIIILAILLFVILNRYRLKNKKNRLLSEQQDIINKKNDALTQIVREKEWLLKEVHHRVKNNLHLIVSLLHTQSRYLRDEGAISAILDSQHRVRSMSLIHQKLYKTDNTSSVYMPEYVNELVSYLKDGFKTGLRIVFTLEIDPFYLDVFYAVPVGLVLNEVITNSIKYAFPHTGNDSIRVQMSRSDQGIVCLRIGDNGKGLPAGFDINHTDTFGMLLIRGLIEDIDGTFELENDNGVTVSISFDSAKSAGI